MSITDILLLFVSCVEALNIKRYKGQRAIIVLIGVVQDKEDKIINLFVNDKTSKNHLEAE